MKYLLNIIQLIIIFISFTRAPLPKNDISNKRITWHGPPLESGFFFNSPKKIYYYLIGTKILYECNGYVFKKHKDVLNYYKFINSNPTICMNLIPKGGVTPSNIPNYHKRIKINEYDYDSVMIKNPFTNKIWGDIWSGCNYYCFRKNNFYLLKAGIISEINGYRRIHDNLPLDEIPDLTRIAQKHVRRTALTYYKDLANVPWFGTVYAVEYKTFANLIIKNLFDKFFGIYNYKNNFYSNQFKEQTQLLWKNSKLIGVGIVECRGLIYVLIICYPKGNIDRQYKKNVPPVSDKVIHICFKKERSSSSDSISNNDNSIINPKNIYYLLIKGHVFYQCNGFVFINHSDALKYYKLVNSKFKIKLIFKPKNGVKASKVKFYNTKVIIGEYNYNDVVKRNPFTDKIWVDIWEGCDYYCFKANNFKTLRQGLILEMNNYRRIHGIKPLTENIDMSILAQKIAFQIAWTGYGCIPNLPQFGAIYEFLPKTEANLVIKYMFDYFFGYYNYNNNRYLVTFSRQTQILWGETRRIGVGIAKSKGIIFFVFLFYPKGNTNWKYKKNVPPVSDKVIHLYNLLKSHLN
uniref:SCP domain-containing protein n=2 Tax=Strongyloides stercoralis TaxID=6248 RepID=A0A0K0EL43_STRER